MYVCVCHFFTVLNQLTDFDEIWCGRYAIGGHTKAVLLILCKVPLIITWRMCQHLKYRQLYVRVLK
jgi:hypothetical protein